MRLRAGWQPMRGMSSYTALGRGAVLATGRDCWCVAIGNSFNDSERCLLAGYDNGDIKMFDLRMNQVGSQPCWGAGCGGGGSGGVVVGGGSH